MNSLDFFSTNENMGLVISPPTQAQVNEFQRIQNNQAIMKQLVDDFQNGRNPGKVEGFVMTGLPNPLHLYNFVGQWAILITGPNIFGPFTANLINIQNIYQPNSTWPPFPYYTFHAVTWPAVVSPGMPPYYPLKYFLELTSWAIY